MTKKNKNLEDLIKENNKKINLLMKKIDNLEGEFKRFQLMNFLRFLLVIIPIVLAVLYLIPVFREFLEIYKPLFDTLNSFKPL